MFYRPLFMSASRARRLHAKPFQATLLIVSLSAMATRLVPADERPAGPKAAKTTVALIDVKYVLEHHPGFRRAKEELAVDVKLAEALLALRKGSLQKLEKDRQAHKRGSDAYRQLDQLLASELAEYQVQAELGRKQFARQEAELYRVAYQQIRKAVDEHIAQHGISVVIRFDRSAASDASEPEEVLAMLNRPIVAYDAAADITDEIVRRLSKAAPPQVTERPGPPSPR